MRKLDYLFWKTGISGKLVGACNLIVDLNAKGSIRKTERIEYLLNSAIVPISKAEIANKLLDVSIKTIESTLANLLKNKKIKKIGSYIDAKYVKR